MPTIFDVINRLDFLRGVPAVYVVLATAVFIITVRDWQLVLLALAGQYLAAGLLFVDVLDPRLAALKVLTGLFVCLILTITAWQTGYGRSPDAVKSSWKDRGQIASYLFRLAAALILLSVIWIASRQPAFMLPNLPVHLSHLNLAVYGLGGLGLLTLALAADPLPAGVGLLMLMTGYELYYSVWEQSTAVLAVLAAVNLILSIVIAYLTQRHRVLHMLSKL